MQVTWNEVRARRVERHSLTSRVRGTAALVDLAHRTCGIHAQVMASAELSICARVDGITQQDVRDALWRDRTLVKAWTIRGTLHLHPAEELPLWYAALRAAAGTFSDEAHGMEAWRDPQGRLLPALEPDEVNEIRAAVLDALDGRCLLREELAAEVVRRVGPKVEQRLLSGFAFFGGADLCQGPPQGPKITLARPDQWISDWRDVNQVEALREVARRYTATYGPVRPEDFGVWLGGRTFRPADARALFHSLGPELEEVDVEGQGAFVLAGDLDFPEALSSLRLLPEYDVYVMGFREREHLVPEDVKAQVAAHARGRYEGPAGVRFLLVDGVTAGLWERKRRGKKIGLEVNPVRKPSRPERAELEQEAERVGAFLGLEPVLTVG